MSAPSPSGERLSATRSRAGGRRARSPRPGARSSRTGIARNTACTSWRAITNVSRCGWHRAHLEVAVHHDDAAHVDRPRTPRRAAAPLHARGLEPRVAQVGHRAAVDLEACGPRRRPLAGVPALGDGEDAGRADQQVLDERALAAQRHVVDDLPALVGEALEPRAHGAAALGADARPGRWRPSRRRRATPAARRRPRRRGHRRRASARGRASSATSARRYACAARRRPSSRTGSSTTTSPDCRSTEPTRRAGLLRDEETVGAVAPPPPHRQDIFHVCIIGTARRGLQHVSTIRTSPVRGVARGAPRRHPERATGAQARRLERQAHRVHAEPVARGGLRGVVEHVPEVRAAPRAAHLGAHHARACGR